MTAMTKTVPETEWPFKRGERVWMLTYGGEIIEGYVTEYTPSSNSVLCYCHGKPEVTISSGASDEGHTVGSLRGVRRYTEVGRRELVAEKWRDLLKKAAGFDELAAKIRAEAEALK